MKIRLPVHAMLDKRGYIILKETCKADHNLVLSLFEKKKDWENRNRKEYFFDMILALEYQKRTFKQLSSVWILVTTIFESMEGRKPTEEEKYALYLDLLDQYADKVPNRFGGLRPVHISKSNSIEGARFIDGLLYCLSTMCSLDYGAQVTVQGVLMEWEEWRGNLKIDPMDYSDLACTKLLTEAEWREKHPVSEASGKGGRIELAHIVTRGADGKDIEMPWNWIALTHEEHIGMQHQKGWDEFLQIYPHLRGRVERARQMAGKLELKALPKKPHDLALEALGNE